jgi:hypothetical protein
MSWLFSLFGFGDSAGVLVLQPDASAQRLAGFHTGQPLELKTTTGETVGELLDKFNTYRGPEQQITQLWTANNHPIDFATRVIGRVNAVVKYATPV